MMEGDPEIDFSLYYADAPASAGYGAPAIGDLIESDTASWLNTPPGVIEFDTELLPGAYLLCEYVPFGYDTSLANGTYGVDWWYPGVDAPTDSETGPVCVPFTVPDQATDMSSAPYWFEITVDNTKPGQQRTIGYWRNWTSCDGNGNQDPVLDETLAKAPGGTIYIGYLPVDTCEEAILILAKTPVDTDPNQKGRKNKDDNADNPAFNAAAQFLAHQLNILMPAEQNCTAANEAADILQALLENYGFDGTVGWDMPTWKGKDGAEFAKNLAHDLNLLAWVLDLYNNDMLRSSPGCNYDVEANLWSDPLPDWDPGDALPY